MFSGTNQRDASPARQCRCSAAPEARDQVTSSSGNTLHCLLTMESSGVCVEFVVRQSRRCLMGYSVAFAQLQYFANCALATSCARRDLSLRQACLRQSQHFDDFHSLCSPHVFTPYNRFFTDCKQPWLFHDIRSPSQGAPVIRIHRFRQ